MNQSTEQPATRHEKELQTKLDSMSDEQLFTAMKDAGMKVIDATPSPTPADVPGVDLERLFLKWWHSEEHRDGPPDEANESIARLIWRAGYTSAEQQSATTQSALEKCRGDKKEMTRMLHCALDETGACVDLPGGHPDTHAKHS